MRVLAIDPGSSSSAFVVLHDGRIAEHGQLANQALLARLVEKNFGGSYVTVIESVEFMGMRVGRSIFETCFWSGRFAQASRPFTRISRTAVKLQLCHSRKANDRDIRNAIIRRCGGHVAAIGTKLAKGPLYGITTHRWSALAVAIAYLEQERQGQLLKGVNDGEEADTEVETEREVSRTPAT